MTVNMFLATHNFLARIDDECLVLLGGGLEEVGREAVPQEVHQSVRRRHVLLHGGVLLLGSPDVPRVPGPDGDHEDDAEDDGQDGGGEVVDHRTHPHLAGQGQVHRT